MTALRKARKARGLTQAELAEKVGITQGHISFIESGGQTSAALAERIVEVLGRDLIDEERILYPSRFVEGLAA